MKSEKRIALEEGRGVLLSKEEYESLLETLELLSQPGFYESIKQADLEIEGGDTLSLDDVFGEGEVKDDIFDT